MRNNHTRKNTGEQSSARCYHCLRARATAPPVGMLHPASDRGEFRRPCVACAFQRQAVSARWHSPSDFLDERTKNLKNRKPPLAKREKTRGRQGFEEKTGIPANPNDHCSYIWLWYESLLVCTNDYPLVLQHNYRKCQPWNEGNHKPHLSGCQTRLACWLTLVGSPI